MSTERIYNFNPGPAALPLEVIEAVRDGFTKFGGMSVLEISHRSKAFSDICDEARMLLARLLAIPDGYHVIFLHGGASQQFAMVPMNLMDKRADYAITGRWSGLALKEAKLFGKTHIAFSSEKTKFSRTPRPEEIDVGKKTSYLHITSNNTVYGTQYHEFPDTGDIPLVADMSSDICSRPIDVPRFGLIYASAQKNLGPAGLAVVIIRNDLVKRRYRDIPTMFRYQTHVEGESRFNTPPVFAIYVMMLVLRWMEGRGGLTEIARANEQKAKFIYDVLDSSSFYRAMAEREGRSAMNVTFSLPSEPLARRFLDEAKRRGMVGLAGHRQVGGVRASIYNAHPPGGAQALAEFMQEFERSR